MLLFPLINITTMEMETTIITEIILSNNINLLLSIKTTATTMVNKLIQ